MTQSELPIDMARLRDRLKTVLDEASDTKHHYGAQYCLECDEYTIRTEIGELGLDCRHDHYDEILRQEIENPEINAWVECIDHLLQQTEK